MGSRINFHEKRKLVAGIAVNQIDLIAAIGKHLERKHGKMPVLPRHFNAVVAAANLIVEAFGRDEVPATDGMGFPAWLASDDTGASSLYMAAVLSGTGSRNYAHPHDADDFGRCVRLLKAAPELRERLPKLAKTSRYWEAFVSSWDRLEELYASNPAEADKVIRGVLAGVLVAGISQEAPHV